MRISLLDLHFKFCLFHLHRKLWVFDCNLKLSSLLIRHLPRYVSRTRSLQVMRATLCDLLIKFCMYNLHRKLRLRQCNLNMSGLFLRFLLRHDSHACRL